MKFPRGCHEVYRALFDIAQTDARIYTYGGIWLHPCGRYFLEEKYKGEKDYQKKNGRWVCYCATCKKMRKALRIERKLLKEKRDEVH